MSVPLYLNIIPFNHKVDKIPVVFTPTETPNHIRFRGDKVPAEVHRLLDKSKPFYEQFVFASFSPEKYQMTFEVDLNIHFSIALKYYTNAIENYFLKTADAVERNFIKDNEIWIKDSTANPLFTTYKVFVVKVQFHYLTQKPQLLISYEGIAKVSKQSINDLVKKNIDPGVFNKVIYNKNIIRYRRLLDNDNFEFNNIFPIINKKLSSILRIPFEAKSSIPKYKRYHDNIVDFYNRFINTSAFKAIIDHSGKWLTIDREYTFRTSKDSNLLLFGQGHKNHTPKDGINAGPYQIKDAKLLKFFFIAHESDLGNSQSQTSTTAKLQRYLIGKEGFFSIPDKLKIPLIFDDTCNISFKNTTNPLPEVAEKIANTTFSPEYKYLGFYISPYSKEQTTETNDAVYYRIKEELLKKRVTSQVIERETIFQTNFKFSIMNIGIAVLAKLGSIPWRLDRPIDDELIVGVGAFYSKKKQSHFLGSAFCFSNDGQFKGFDSFPESDLFALSGSIREAVERFSNENKEAKRLVIHFYKRISKEEVNAILKELNEKLKLKIPVIILTINKTESRDYILFDSSYSSLMPLSGTYVRVGHNTFILCNNTRYSDAPIGSMDGHPLPIKIKISSTDEELLKDGREIGKLLDQAYQFSRMYWKSIKQQNWKKRTN